MQLRDGRPIFSPSDLSDFLACGHLTTLELAAARGEAVRPLVDDPQADLLRRKGEEHEARYLAQLLDAGKRVVTIELARDAGGYRDYDAAMAAVALAMRDGADAIYQAALVDGGWRGVADFLERRPDGVYEAVDTKLARHAKPSHLFQLAFYSEVLAKLQASAPTEMHVELGSGERASFRVSDYDAYCRRVRASFLAAVERRAPTYPYPVEHCPLCAWHAACEQRWLEDDHLVQVAGIRRKQVERLVAAGVGTLAGLARTPAGTVVPRVQAATFDSLRHQASLQQRARESGALFHEPLQLAEGRGFALLPEPDEGDVWFDIEGDPFYDAGGSLEYLFGVAHLEHGEARFRAFWGTDRAGEKRAFEELVDFLVDRRRAHPGLHVYHYASYERSALQRLMQAHMTREDEIDELLRGDVLVDLHQVVRQALRLSLPSYSLKQVEAFYFPPRATDVGAGDESTVVFERWLENGDDALLASIERYNEDDCRSTHELHRWLLGLRPRGLPWRPPPERRPPSEEAQAASTERDQLRERLLAGAQEGDPRWLAAHLLDYHRRDAKPAWWEYFRRLTLDEQELVDDGDAIGGLELDPDAPLGEEKQSYVYTLAFPSQEFKVGEDAIDPATERSPGTIAEIDPECGRVLLKRAQRRHEEPLPRALVPPEPYRTDAQRAALLRLARALADGTGEYAAARQILAREPPSTLDPLALDGDHLFVQGPPGSGKTWTGAEWAVRLMAAGARVGITATSHKAIHKLLDDVVVHAARLGVTFSGLKKASTGRESTRYGGSPSIANSEQNGDFVDDGHDLIAGTSWLLAREDVRVDTLFVDEAGQVSLADALATATCARNVILLGDPNQLPQVSQGAQPASVRASVLEHLLGPAATVPEGRGLFLERTWRLRPELCRFVSDTFYDGRLETAPVCALRSVSDGVGLRFLAVEHVGSRQESPEEARAIADEIERLLGATFTDERGTTRPLRHEDVLVVAPYNRQVRCLRAALPRAVPVGTVDRFQGQQAPVVFFSMTTSTGEDLPRGVEFLFSPNRFNVAISRAQCLAYVVASPRLLETRCSTPEQMRLVNVVCRFAEQSGC